MTSFDYIIAGRGLAGSVLALSLMRNNKSVLVIDEPSLSSSSKVAAGLFQPMTFKRTIETWQGLNSIQAATEFYQWAEKELNDSFFHPLQMSRIFSSYEEQNNWSLKCDDPYYGKLINETRNEEAETCKPPYGYGGVNYAGYLDVKTFLHSTRIFLEKSESLIEEKIDYDAIRWEDGNVFYRENKATKLIFCEGWLIKDNPWFGYVPMKPVKGEVLSVTIPERNNRSIISSGVFCVPVQNGNYKVGSNYDWKNLNETISDTVKQELTAKLKEMLGVSEVKVTDHKAGIRPASNDRRPIIGVHPQYDFFMVFNGLGARGVSLAPFSSGILSDFLLGNHEIPSEMNVSRFNKYFHR